MRFFTENIGLKLAAFLIAIGVWFYVTVSASLDRYFPGNLFVEIRNKPAHLLVIYDKPKIKVRLRATNEDWVKVNARNLTAFLDLTDLSEGTHDVKVNVEVDRPNISIVEVEPASVSVRLEAITEREIPIRAIFTGQAEKGFVAGEPEISPDKVVVRGARSIIETLSQAQTQIDLAGERSDFERKTLVYLANGQRQKQLSVEMRPKYVDVLIPIFPVSGSKTVGIKLRTIGRPNPDYYILRIETMPSLVDIRSTTGTLPSVTVIETEPVPIEGLNHNLSREVKLIVPSGIKISRQRKVRARIVVSENTIEREIAATTQAQLTEGLTLTSAASIKIVVSGPAKIVRNLTSEEITVSLDLSEKEAGTYRIPLTKEMITVPENCTPTLWLPSSVIVTIESPLAG